MLYIVYLVIGILAGLLAGLLGIGGGIVVVPSLLLIFKLTSLFPSASAMHIAVGTSLATIIFTSSASAFAYNRKRLVIWPTFWYLLPGLAAGVIAGAIIAKHISSRTLTDYFAVTLILIAIHIFFRHQQISDNTKPELNTAKKIGLLFLSIAVGLFAAFFGLSGGVLVIPTLIFFGFNIRQAAGTAAICGLPIALLGTMVFMLNTAPVRLSGLVGFVYWPIAIIIAASSMLFAPIGVKISTTFSQKLLRKIFAIILFTAGLNLIDPISKIIVRNSLL